MRGVVSYKGGNVRELELPMSDAAREESAIPAALSPRAIATGLLTGALLILGNLTVGLSTGLWDSGQITASLIAFAIAHAIPRGGMRFSILENNVAQVIACAAAAVPAAMGLLGAIPALQELGIGARAHALPIFALGISIALLGAGLAFLLARRLLDEEKLPFPTGTAAAGLITALHADGKSARDRTRALVIAGAVALLVVWLRDREPSLLPAALLLPLIFHGVSLSLLGVGIGVSPLLWGVGMVVGARIAIATALGALVAWGLYGSQRLSSGLSANADELAAYLVWPGVALLVGATAIDLLGYASSLLLSLRDLRNSLRERLARFLLPALVLAAIALVSASVVTGLSLAAGALAIVLLIPLGGMVGRAAGQTDVAPISQSGQLAQAALGPLTALSPAANIAGGALVAGGSAEVSSILWSLRVGRILGAKARDEFRAALIGIGFGAAFSLPAYLLLTGRAPIGSARNPAPGALQWRAFAELVAQGAGGIPSGAVRAAIVCAIFGALLALLLRTRLARFIPSPLALGIGFLIPAFAAGAILLGGLGVFVFTRAKPARAAELVPSIAAGLISGEALLAFALAAFAALR